MLRIHVQHLWHCNIHVPTSTSIQPEDDFLKNLNMSLIII